MALDQLDRQTGLSDAAAADDDELVLAQELGFVSTRLDIEDGDVDESRCCGGIVPLKPL